MQARWGWSLLSVAMAVQLGAQQRPEIAWEQGPKTVSLGSQADLKLGESYVFANGADTRKLMEAGGNSVSNNEVGFVRPAQGGWALIFEYDSVGYVKDDEKDKIDKDALLKNITEGTEQGNARRKEAGVPGLHVTGWFEEPHYDERTHNLVWALQAKDDHGEEVVNYNMRVLGRQGVMSITLIDGPQEIANSRVEVEQLMGGFGYKTGKTYAEWKPGDKLAQYGLTALVAGGAGAAAAKLGLFAWLAKFFAKAGKAIVVGAVALLAAARGLIAKLFGRKSSENA